MLLKSRMGKDYELIGCMYLTEDGNVVVEGQDLQHYVQQGVEFGGTVCFPKDGMKFLEYFTLAHIRSTGLLMVWELRDAVWLEKPES